MARKRDLEAEKAKRTLRELERKFGGQIPFGYSMDPDDSIYLGEQNELDPDPWIHNNLGPNHPLENILLRIIRAHPDPKQVNSPASKMVDESRRLQRALKHLVRYELLDGPIDKDGELLQIIAELEWNSINENNPSKFNFSGAVRCAQKLQDNSQSATAEQFDVVVRRLRPKYKKHRVRLLKQHTGRLDQAQIDRRANEEKALSYIGLLGVDYEK